MVGQDLAEVSEHFTNERIEFVVWNDRRGGFLQRCYEDLKVHKSTTQRTIRSSGNLHPVQPPNQLHTPSPTSKSQR